MVIIGRGRTRPSLIIDEALQSNDEFLYHWGDNPPLTPYRGVTNTRMKSPLRQHQRLEGRGKHLYKYLSMRSNGQVHKL